jgi:hypothetical protein
MKQKLDNFNFFSLHAFLTAGSDERDRLAFFQALEAVSLDGFEVYEQVVTGLWGDEAEAFFIVEPLNGTGLAIGHGLSPWTKVFRLRNALAETECKKTENSWMVDRDLASSRDSQ